MNRAGAGPRKFYIDNDSGIGDNINHQICGKINRTKEL